MNRVFEYGVPAWGNKLIALVYMLVAFVFLFGFSTYDSWVGDSLSVGKYIFLMVGLVFLLIAFNPRNWKSRTYFSADDSGLHFPSPDSSLPSLGINWCDVGDIKFEKLYGGVYGLSIELRISQKQIESYFKQASRANKILGFDCTRGAFFVVGYANTVFQKTQDAISHLLELKKANL